MTVKFGFYNSVGGDRVYDALDVSRFFDGFITDGVFQDFLDEFLVEETTGMTINVKPGRAWFHHTWTYNDAILPLTLNPSSLLNARIDAVVLEIDSSNDVRENSIKIIDGTPSDTPTPPVLEHTAEKNQYPLAYIQVPTGISTILSSHITITVGTYLCPWITFPPAINSGGASIIEVQVFS